MTNHDVVIVGAGPTGMMLGAELTLAGVDVVVLERRHEPELESSRAGGLHARTIEILDQRGIAERFVSEGQVMQVQMFGLSMLDISDLPTRRNHGLALWQKDFERILAGWIEELGVPVRRDVEVTAVTQDADGVDVSLVEGSTVRCRYLVACDGGRSTVRRATGIGFTGLDPTTSWLVAEVELTDPQLGLHRDRLGTHGMTPLGPDGGIRLVLTEATLHTGDPDADQLREALTAVYGSDLGLHTIRWVSRFTDASRLAERYREGRVLLAGDAAHIHPPQGGQGMNTGVQDAANLGWKLAQVAAGVSSPDLLDTYEAERRPVAARVIHNVSAMVALANPDERHDALRDILGELVALDEPRRRLGAMIAGLDIAYDLGGNHPLVGRRMPDLGLQTAHGPTTVYAQLHGARPVFLNLTGRPADLGPWADRVPVVDATTDGPWDLPLIGEVDAPEAVLVRPDGHVAWAGSPTDTSLTDALTMWFGAPETAADGERQG